MVAVIADGDEGHFEGLADDSLEILIFIVKHICTRTVNRIARLSAGKLIDGGKLVVAETLLAAFERMNDNGK